MATISIITTMTTKIIFWQLVGPLISSLFILMSISSLNKNLDVNIISSISCDHNRLNESLLASQHYNRILKYAKCQHPYARVVNIQNELHPSAIKKYIPHCTILHYCGPYSGCCRLETEQCVPKSVEDVKLYFWTIEVTPRGHKKGIEVLTMKNHTECMCAPIISNMKHHRNYSTFKFNSIYTTSTTTTTTMDPYTLESSRLTKTNSATSTNHLT